MHQSGNGEEEKPITQILHGLNGLVKVSEKGLEGLATKTEGGIRKMLFLLGAILALQVVVAVFNVRTSAYVSQQLQRAEALDRRLGGIEESQGRTESDIAEVKSVASAVAIEPRIELVGPTSSSGAVLILRPPASSSAPPVALPLPPAN